MSRCSDTAFGCSALVQVTEFVFLGGRTTAAALEDGGGPAINPKKVSRRLPDVCGTGNCQPDAQIRTLRHEAGPRRQPTSSWNCGEGGASRPSGAGPNDLQMVNGPPGPVFRVESSKTTPPHALRDGRPMRNGSNGCTQPIKRGNRSRSPSASVAAAAVLPLEAHRSRRSFALHSTA